MDLRVKCCLLYLMILGFSTHVTPQDATSTHLDAGTITPAETSETHAKDAGELTTLGVPRKLAVPGPPRGKEASTIKPMHNTTLGAVGMHATDATHPRPDLKLVTVGGKTAVLHTVTQTTPGAIKGKEAHSLHPSPDSTTGAIKGKEAHSLHPSPDSTTGAIKGKEAHSLHPSPDSTTDKSGGKKSPHLQSLNETAVNTSGGKKSPHLHSLDETTVSAIKGKEAHSLHPSPDSTTGAIKGKEAHSLHPSPDSTTAGPVGGKEAHTIHPVHDTTLAHVKVQRPKHLISRMFHPPTVDPVVLQNDYIILCVCAPGIVFWLIVLVIVTIRRKRKGRVQKRNSQTLA